LQKPGGARQSNWVFARVSVITNGNKAPGGFANHVFGTEYYSLSEITPRRPPASGISLKKAAPPALFADCFFYNHVLPLYMYSCTLDRLIH
jgi:hypothetical protein